MVLLFACRAAARTAGAVVAMVWEPPELGPCGKRESPNFISTLSIGSPNMSAMICAMIVYVPVPMSWVQQAATACPSAYNFNLTEALLLLAGYVAVAIP